MYNNKSEHLQIFPATLNLLTFQKSLINTHVIRIYCTEEVSQFVNFN